MSRNHRSSTRARWLAIALVVIAGAALLPSLQYQVALADEVVNLGISTYAETDEVVAGETVTFVVGVSNSSATPVTATVTDVLPTGTAYVGAVIAGGTCAEAAGTVTCTLDVPAGMTVSFRLRLHVLPDYVAMTPGLPTLSNTVTVAPVSTPTCQPADPCAVTDGNSANDSATAGVFVVGVADLSVVKFTEPAGSIPAGQVFIYTIWVDNWGPSTAKNATIADTLLSSGQVSIQSCAFSMSQGGGSITQFTCTTGNLVSTQFGTDIGTMRTNFLDPVGPTTDDPPATTGRLRASFRLVAKFDIDVTNTTRTYSDTFDPDTSNNFADTLIDITAVADLQAFGTFGAEVQANGLPGKRVDTNLVTPMPDPTCCNFGGTTVTAGRRIQWDTTVVNAGPSNAENVRIVVKLPEGASLVENTLTGSPVASPNHVAGRCYTDPAGEQRTTVICEYGRLYAPGYDCCGAGPGVPLPPGNPAPPADTAALRFVMLIDPSLPPGTQLSVDAYAESETDDMNFSNNITSIQFDSNAWADLAVTKVAAVDPVVAGTDLTYTVQSLNQGPSAAQQLTIVDQVPANTTFVSATPSAGGLCLEPPVGGVGTITCTWDGATAPGLTRTVQVIVHVDSSVPDGSQITNEARTVSDTPDPLQTDNVSASVVTNVIAIADLEITKQAIFDVLSPVRVKYVLTVRNLGPSDAANVHLVDVLPLSASKLYFFTVSTTNGTCAYDKFTHTVTCDRGPLAAGQEWTVELIVVNITKLMLVNTATISSSTTDPVLENNTAVQTIQTKGYLAGYYLWW